MIKIKHYFVLLQAKKIKTHSLNNASIHLSMFGNIIMTCESEAGQISKKYVKVTLRDANSHKSGWFEGVHNCRLESKGR